MKTIGQFLDQSKRPVYSVGPNAAVREALELMAKHNIGALLVLDNESPRVSWRPVGLSQTDMTA